MKRNVLKTEPDEKKLRNRTKDNTIFLLFMPRIFLQSIHTPKKELNKIKLKR